MLVALRLSRRWNQTGQKHAGEVDIARSFFPTHNMILWLTVVATYMYTALRVAGRRYRLLSIGTALVFSGTISVTALWFKMAFTFADAPELFGGLPPILLEQLTPAYLLTQARALFLGLTIATTYTAICEVGWSRASRLQNPRGGLLSYPLLQDKLTPTQLLHGLYIIF